MPHGAAVRPWSRRRPYPYDAYIGTLGVILEPQADGNLVSQKTKTLDATAPVDYTYSAANPYKERAFEWDELYGGFGQGTAPTNTGHPRRYSHAEKADLSIDGLWMKGPKFSTHAQTIDAAAGEVRQLIWGMHGGTLTLFAVCQNGVYRRTSDAGAGGWTVSLSAATLGAGVFPQQAVRFKARYAGAGDYLYLATSASNLYRYDGAAWTVAGAAAGPGDAAANGEARYIEKIRDELWVAGDYWVVRSSAGDPMLRASWAGVIWIGDQTEKITWLRQMEDQLFIFKEDNVYSVDTDGIDHDLFPTLRGKIGMGNSISNGKNAAVWINRMWFAYGGQTYIMSGDAQLQPDGMEQMLENVSDVHGQFVAGVGHNTWFMYELIYNPSQTHTYLIKHGTWVEAVEQGQSGVSEFAEAHHGAIYDWDARGTCMDIIAGLAVNDRLYVGFSNGTVQWCVLPRNSPNPAEDSNCEFCAEDSYVYLPVHHSNFRADNKLYHAITVTGPRLTTTEWVEVEYRLDTVNDLAEWTLVAPEQPKFTLPSQRFSFTEDEVTHPVFSKNIQIRVILKKDSDLGASPAALSPVTSGIVVHESIRPAFSREFTLSVKAGTYLPRHDGLVSRRRGADIKQHILEEAAKVGPVSVTLPEGDVEPMTLIDYRDSAASWGKRRDHEYLIQIQGIQLGFLTGETGETASGLTYATLETYTLGELESVI